MDADANANAGADALCSAIALRGLAPGELKMKDNNLRIVPPTILYNTLGLKMVASFQVLL